MAGGLKIKSGTKMQIAYDVPVSKQPNFNMASTFKKNIDDSAFLISIPMQGGKGIPMDENQKLLIKYGSGENTVIIAGYADDAVKDGIRTYWKIRRVTEQRQFIKRVDERLKVSLKIEYTQDDWPVDEHGKTEREDALSLDLSAGGAALFLNRRFEVGEILDVFLPRIGTTEDGHALDNVLGVVCWFREAPKGGSYKFICGLQFRFSDGSDRDTVKRYVGVVKKRYKL